MGDIPFGLNLNLTIECLNDLISLFVSLGECIKSTLDDLNVGLFESVYFVIQMEDYLSDMNNLMQLYTFSLYYNSDIEFQYIQYLSIWKSVITEFAGRPIIWCMRHVMPLSQLMVSIDELKDVLLVETQELGRQEQI